MNYCTSCDCDFASVRAFDAHRVGRHSYLYADGLRMDPPREDGRRCLHESEMRERGFTKNTRGRWADPTSLRNRPCEGCYSLTEATIGELKVVGRAESQNANMRLAGIHSEAAIR